MKFHSTSNTFTKTAASSGEVIFSAENLLLLVQLKPFKS